MSEYAIPHRHIEHTCNHAHSDTDHTTEVSPSAAENLLLELISKGKNNSIDTSRATNNRSSEDLINDVVTRLEDTLPNFNPLEHPDIIRAFTEEYQHLPVAHAHHAHDDHHDSHHSCGKLHGPLRRRFDNLQDRILGKLSNKRAKALAAVAFRLSTLVVCPGDDLAAIGLQVYGSISGHAMGEDDHEEQAVLPREVRIYFRKSGASINIELGNEIRSHVRDTEAKQQKIIDIPKTTPLEKEKRRGHKRRHRIMAIGGIALGILGICVGSTAKDPGAKISSVVSNTPPKTQAPPPEYQTPTTTPDIPIKMNSIIVKKGDSQWKINKDHVEKATGKSNSAVINILTAYSAHLNKITHPNPDLIKEGQEIWAPSPEVITTINAAIAHPENTDPTLVNYINGLNQQTSYSSKNSKELIEHLDGYLQLTLNRS